MLLDASRTHAAAAILADRRLQGLSGPCLPDELRPQTLEDALAIQAAVGTHMGQAVGGWKCGTPGPGKLVVAPIYAPTIHMASPCPAWAHEGAVRVEPELAFVIGQDLPARDLPYAPADVDAAIARTHLALELCDSRYSDQATLSFADKLADGLVNQGLFIGPEVDGERAALTPTMQIDISIDGHAQPCRAGQHPDPLPRLPLYWLAEHLRGSGQGLRAGQVVITGSYAGTFGLPVDAAVRVRFGALGELLLTLSARDRSASSPR
ncbi:MAG: fumarylacetoacetate hydrolase family protein [Aquabacterium sp.]